VSGELIVNDTTGAKPRMAGHEFSLDSSGLWLTRFARVGYDGWTTVALDASGMFGLSFGKAVLWGGTPTPVKPPAGASTLWDNPETVTGEIVAYRAWDYDFQVAEDGTVGVRLESINQDFYWDGPVTTADEVPTATNDKGLYAIRGDEHHRENFKQYMKGAAIWGRVALSGTVVEGQYGYRAERAAIQELWVRPTIDREDSSEGLCKLLADRYQCDATVRAPKWRHVAEKPVG
jgi:hypothetical protein